MSAGLLLAVSATACGGEHPVVADAPIDTPPLPLELDIEVVYGSQAGSQYANVRVWTGGTDQPGGCDDSNWRFPAIGACELRTDGLACGGESCLRAELVGSGVQQEATIDYWISFDSLALPLPADLVMRLSGCGHSTFDVPIEPFVPPVPTLDVEVSAPDLLVRWTTDIPAASAIASSWLGLGGSECHVVANEQEFVNVVGSELPPYASVGVTTFLPMIVHPTPAGDARLWRGAGTGMYLEDAR